MMPAAAGRARFADGLFGRYALVLVSLVTLAILASGLMQIVVAYQQSRAAVFRLADLEAAAAAGEIDQFLENLEQQIGWVVPPPALRRASSGRRSSRCARSECRTSW